MTTPKEEVIDTCEKIAQRPTVEFTPKEEDKNNMIAGDYFLLTSNYEGYDLFEKLVFDRGFENVEFNAHYNWEVERDGRTVRFLEGDIYIE